MKGIIAALAVLCAATAGAAPNVANVTQKGSLLVFPDVDVRGQSNTLVRLQNDGTQDVDVKCYWMDGNKNRVDFIVPVTRSQAVWFDAATGAGSFQVNPFPRTPANGLDNPYLVGPTQPPLSVGVAAGAVQTFGTTTTVTTSPVATTTVAMSPFGNFLFGFEQIAVNFGAWLGPPNTSVPLTGTLNRDVTINGVTQTVSQPFTLTLGDYAIAGVNQIAIGASTPVTFVLPDGRQIIYTAFGNAQATNAPGLVTLGVDSLFELTNPEVSDDAGPYGAGLLACWVIDPGGQQQLKWNHLSGTATVYNPDLGAYEYSAFAFTAPTGLDLEPVGAAGVVNLNATDYDACPLYLIGQFTPVPDIARLAGNLRVFDHRLVTAACTLDLRQDYFPAWTKLQFEIWNEDEVKFTGAYECADSWHETFLADDIDAAADNFSAASLNSFTARYRVQGVKSTQCPGSQTVGLLAVHASGLGLQDGARFTAGTTLAGAGKTSGRISWDPSGAVPEGGIR